MEIYVKSKGMKIYHINIYCFVCFLRIIMAHQLLSRYMMSANDEEFEKSLVGQLGFTPKSAAMTCDGLKEMRRHLI
jgi:hypothetical protein